MNLRRNLSHKSSTVSGYPGAWAPGTCCRGGAPAPPLMPPLPKPAPASLCFASSCSSALLTRRLSYSDMRRRSVTRGGRTGGRLTCAAARQRASELGSSARSSTHTSCTWRFTQTSSLRTLGMRARFGTASARTPASCACRSAQRGFRAVKVARRTQGRKECIGVLRSNTAHSSCT